MDELNRPAQFTASYAEACQRFADLVGGDSPVVDPRRQARLLTHGHATQRGIVFFHGLSNSPPQFDRLAQRFKARGYNVFLPRAPYHGYLDRMSTDHARLTVQDMVDFASSTIDLAAGLADELTIAGISLGGVLTAWAAQYRAVALAAPIAPALGVPVLPLAVSGTFFRAMGHLPNRFVWWDPRYRERLPGPEYAYPRFATHAMVAMQALGGALVRVASKQPPLAHRICMISNAADFAVSNSAGDALVRGWRSTGASSIQTFRFPRRLKLTHDIVDPLQPGANPDLIYPILEQLIIDGSVPDAASLGVRDTPATEAVHG